MKHINVKKKCPVCNNGEMKFSGIVLTSYPPYYKHHCDVCEGTGSYTKTYPYQYDEYDLEEMEERWEK